MKLRQFMPTLLFGTLMIGQSAMASNHTDDLAQAFSGDLSANDVAFLSGNEMEDTKGAFIFVNVNYANIYSYAVVADGYMTQSKANQNGYGPYYMNENRHLILSYTNGQLSVSELQSYIPRSAVGL